MIKGAVILGALLLATPAIADEVNWTGFYAGLHAGYSHGNVSVKDTNGGVKRGPFNYSTDGGFGGAQVGYNYQFNRFVAGLESDFGYMSTKGKGRISSASATSHQDLTLDSGFYADITARFGYVIGNGLIYGKGGWAYFDTDAKQATTNPGYSPKGTGALDGWTLGAGYEHRLTKNISVKVEYQHFDFGTASGYQKNVGDLSSPIGYKFKNEHEVTFDTIKVGLNWYF